MQQLPMTNTWICPECSNTAWHTQKEAEEQVVTEEE